MPKTKTPKAAAPSKTEFSAAKTPKLPEPASPKLQRGEPKTMAEAAKIYGNDLIPFHIGDVMAVTVLQKTRGLSGITELKGADGMIFYYNLPQSPTFWNKNTHFDLELVWMRDGKVIGRDFLPSQDKAGLVAKSPSSVVDWVVELKKL